MEKTAESPNFIQTFMLYARMVRFSHTVFALPFALSAATLAWKRHPFLFWDFVWILGAMVGARSAAMGVNRIVDARFDAKNPRTAEREIPAGKIRIKEAAFFTLLSCLLFLFSAAMLGRLCFYLSVPVLFLLCSYSYAKRYTWLTHLYLGLVIGLAPIGAWIAVAKSFSPAVLWLTLALTAYIAGFDVLYACQDTQFDRATGLYSIPARFGVAMALKIAAGLHTVSFIGFLGMGIAMGLGWPYMTATLIIGLLMIVEHRLVRPDDLSKINIAFFHMNSAISITLIAGVWADFMLG
jgi:4-hydroxybenzoate polyprenyltransferase